MTTQKPFDQWNELKKEIDVKQLDRNTFFYEREVWWSSIGINVGVEANGKHANFERPILIIKKFNGHMLWMVPLTSKSHTGPHHYKIIHNKGISFACLSQLKTMSTKRLLRKIGVISESEFNGICAHIADCIKNRTP